VKVTIDAAGRVVIPKQVRARLGLEPGSELELDEVGDHVELRPAGRKAWIAEAADGRFVARSDADVPKLTDEEVRLLLEQQRR
jgi:AbrB family looped-hinge helix DNA binding protein